MKDIQILKKDLPHMSGTAWLIKLPKKVKVIVSEDRMIDTEYFVVSNVHGWMTDKWETMVFLSDDKGKILHWGEVEGDIELTHQEAICRLEKRIKKEKPSNPDVFIVEADMGIDEVTITLLDNSLILRDLWYEWWGNTKLGGFVIERGGIIDGGSDL